MVQVFDSWAGELSPHDFSAFSLPSLAHISSRVRSKLSELSIPTVPMILFAKGANTSLAAQAQHAGYDVLGLDWVIEPSEARRIVDASSPETIALQGNVDPAILYGGKAAIEREVKHMCDSFKGTSETPKAWIANLGHGITPGVDPEDMRYFLQCVHKYSSKVT
jgi:uroporphyrinogen decarboxylase